MDEDYRGNVGVVLFNFSKEVFNGKVWRHWNVLVLYSKRHQQTTMYYLVLQLSCFCQSYSWKFTTMLRLPSKLNRFTCLTEHHSSTGLIRFKCLEESITKIPHMHVDSTKLWYLWYWSSMENCFNILSRINHCIYVDLSLWIYIYFCVTSWWQ